MLAGEVPGVVVNGTSINIQNSFSFQLSTQPLFVVDGIIVPQINDIVPSQVKSIEVLKGASASIYGARGGQWSYSYHSYQREGQEISIEVNPEIYGS